MRKLNIKLYNRRLRFDDIRIKGRPSFEILQERLARVTDRLVITKKAGVFCAHQYRIYKYDDDDFYVHTNGDVVIHKGLEYYKSIHWSENLDDHIAGVNNNLNSLIYVQSSNIQFYNRLFIDQLQDGTEQHQQ